jgi:ABC-2 type transport system permease protein
MNSTLADAVDETGGRTPGSEAAIPDLPPWRVLFTLIRREFWEHRYLWLAPVVVAALLALSPLIGHAALDMPPFGAAESRVALSTLVQWGLWVTLCVVMSFCLAYYLLDCLHAERKDRSILFWKSLPVSDALTVGSKVVVAAAIVPLGVFLLALLTHLLFSTILNLRVTLGNEPLLGFNAVEWLRAEVTLFLVLLLSVLWYAPWGAYLLGVSAFARRSPFLWATLPVVLAPLLERMVLGTHYLWHFINYRSNGLWWKLGIGHGSGGHIISHDHVRPFGVLLHDLDFRGAFTDIDVWLGVAAAAALVYLAIRIHARRDDTAW